MNEVHKGQLVYVLPFGDPGGAGRPAVVVSCDWFHDNSKDVVVCYLTRRVQKRSVPCISTSFSGEKGAWVVPKPSTVSRDRIAATKRYLSEEALSQVELALCRAMAL